MVVVSAPVRDDIPIWEPCLSSSNPRTRLNEIKRKLEAYQRRVHRPRLERGLPRNHVAELKPNNRGSHIDVFQLSSGTDSFFPRR
jgi:hypothetical protein